MPQPAVRKSINVPYGADETIYLVVDRCGSPDRETEIERPDIETIIAELMSGRFNDPIRVVAFNTLEHWAEDISAEVAAEIQTRCDIEGDDIPDYIHDFATRSAAPARSRTRSGASGPAAALTA
jgi:hypothetical protein